MRTWRWYSKLTLALVLAAFVYWVWPTPWRYFSRYDEQWRVHRVTGRSQYLHKGWRDERP